MSSTDEMKRVLRHLNEKIGSALRTERSYDKGWQHTETIVALAYAQGVLDLLVAYLQGDESANADGIEDADVALDDMPTDAELDAEAGDES